MRDQSHRSTRPFFLIVLLLAVCLLVPALSDAAWVFGALLILTSVAGASVLARRRSS